MSINNLKIIDLFSGAGGLTEGFRSPIFDIIAHVEKDKAACATLRLRDCFYYLKENKHQNIYYDFLAGRISKEKMYSMVPDEILSKTINIEINNNTLNGIFEKLDTSIKKQTKIFAIIGGPPCQAYSTIGRGRNSAKKKDDLRIYLYRYYIEFLKKYKPEFFIFENVKGLLSFKDFDGKYLLNKKNNVLGGIMYEEFKACGYELDFRIINTQDYGIPQKRERIVLFGVKAGNLNAISTFFQELAGLKDRTVNLKEAFFDLPKMNAGETKNVYSNEPNQYIKKYYRKEIDVPLTQNTSRPNNARDLAIYREVVMAKQNKHNLKYNELSEELKTHKNMNMFLDRYKALSWSAPSHTVVAHIAKDGHYYIHPDLSQNRSITVREAARIQSFPDDFFFENSRTNAFMQIGNAVPPILSKKIAKAIIQTCKRAVL
ncbi:DNA-cytosine methyltransferase [Ligilactobacillus salitolerans]|uniref:DNA (cytosine-5-)-methyltransferase n=1 Tax=Ligilactobacillus salitolerans TaxID=1808352 RepID=A0A401IRM1_9LACO|nr:DNA cytosine methyltransferase [Ligilactobacillus salitolerans]GBG94178.1 DNA-cytosine methyltransferase [Ligilactobacillus salitolerans]